jgi:hypothetical protein
LKNIIRSLIFLSAVGCASAQSPVTGVFYTDVYGPGGATSIPGGDRKGEACATSILGVYASGDASIETARKNGQITHVSAVDHYANSILGIYAKFCTIVHGRRVGAKDAGAAGTAAPAAQ